MPSARPSDDADDSTIRLYRISTTRRPIFVSTLPPKYQIASLYKIAILLIHLYTSSSFGTNNSARGGSEDSVNSATPPQQLCSRSQRRHYFGAAATPLSSTSEHSLPFSSDIRRGRADIPQCRRQHLAQMASMPALNNLCSPPSAKQQLSRRMQDALRSIFRWDIRRRLING